MKKLAFIFAIAVIVPALVLAWLAMSSLRDQEIVVQSQRALLHQTATDSLAADLNTFMDDVRLYYSGLVDELVTEEDPKTLSENFNDELKARWGQALVGCVVTEQGQILSPAVNTSDPDAQEFLRYNKLFLSNQTRAEVYSTSGPVGNYIKVEEVEEAEESKVLSSLRKIKQDSTDAGRTLAGSFSRQRSEEPSLEFAKNEEKSGTPLLDSGSAEARETVEQNAPAKKAAPPGAPSPVARAKLTEGDDKDLKQTPPESAVAETPPGVELEKPSVAAKDQPKAKAADKVNVAVANSKLRSSAQSRRDYSSINNYQQQLQQVEILAPSQLEEQQKAADFPGQVQEDDLADIESAAGAGGGFANGGAAPSEARGAIISPVNRRTVSPMVQMGNPDHASNQLFNLSEDQLAIPYVNATSWSSISPDNAGLQEIIGDQPEGAIARFLQDGLHVMLWVRHPQAPGKIFWAELDMTQIRERLAEIVAGAAFFQENNNDVSLALLDSSADIVAQTVDGFTTDWRYPFVASEVGEILPQWEVAAYWLDPDALTKSARTARFTLWMLVPILLIAIGFGSILIFRDVNREMFLARQKTDFVSNVSHELKTPLTSIRMFSDLLSTGKSIETEKRTEYLGIISREAARLTRLINNLLDFSRMDRGDRKYNLEKLDAVALARQTVENYRMHLEADGCEPEFRNQNGESAWINADQDAVSQVLVNLLSNADKYACSGKEIILEVATPNPDIVEIRVMDRGPGIHRKDAGKIFEKFFRADDSLATGIQGSGLGLTLARQIAQGHGGDLNFENRDGGGCCFVLTLPTLKS